MRNSPPPPFKGNISVAHCMPLSTRLKGSTIMSPPGFQTQLRPPVTLNFDLLTPEIDHLCPFHAPRGDLCQFASKSVHSFSKNERTSVQTNGRRDRSRTLCVWPVQTGVRINTVSYNMFASVIAFVCFYHAERILSATAKFLVHLSGEGRGGLKWNMGQVGEESGEEKRKGENGNARKKQAQNATHLAFRDAPWELPAHVMHFYRASAHRRATLIQQFCPSVRLSVNPSVRP